MKEKSQDLEKNKDMKNKAIEMAISQIKTQFGSGAIMRLGDSPNKKNMPVIPSGSLSLDLALGVNGFPTGRIIEIFGPESSGKTTVTLHTIAEAQKMGGNAAFIDVEHALDPIYAKKLGVDIDNLLVSQPSTAEEALEIAETLVRSGAIDVIVLDSVAALVPKAEVDGEMGDSHMGLAARLMSQALRKLTSSISKSNTVMFFINQIRMKIGVMFGNPETTTGGNALKFYSSIRLDIRKKEQLKDGENVVGARTQVKVVKNKVAPPFQVAMFDIIFGEGIGRENEILDLGVSAGIINKSGSWFSYNDERIGQGKVKAVDFMKANPLIRDELELKIRKHFFPEIFEESDKKAVPAKKS